MRERIGDLLRIFTHKDTFTASGREIIEKMNLADKEYLDAYDVKSYQANTADISEFFEYFCNFNSEHWILEANPGYDLMSESWIDNSYGLRKEWQREMKLRSLLERIYK